MQQVFGVIAGDVMSKKRRLQDNEVVNMTEECSTILQKKLPQKLKDPGVLQSLVILVVLMALDLGEVKATTITLQLADRSITYPRGTVEDVSVKVDKFIFPAEFVILDMDEDEEAPFIFGRPFLATARALIDVHKGYLTLRFGDEAVIFNIYHAMKGPSEGLMIHLKDVWLLTRKLIKKNIGSYVNKRSFLRVL
ncbi:uncharacterized protein [Henckelia pumila]|uniref:uncharacterized protein n=1 Tax=Henckelia pumila TaxID=405737 RepID=UPI003C6DD5DD